MYPILDPKDLDLAVSTYIMKSGETRFYSTDLNETWKAVHAFLQEYPKGRLKMSVSETPRVSLHPKVKPVSGKTMPEALCRALLIAKEALDSGRIH